MLNKLIAALIISLTTFSYSAQKKKVLIIGIDGCRPDCLEAAKTPNMDSLIKNGTYTNTAYAGGELGKETQQPTVSGPGWVSITTGVWANTHGVKNNKFSGYDIKKAPHFFKRIKDQNPKLYLSSISQWHPINSKILTPSVKADFILNPPDKGASVKDLTVKHLKEANPDVLFVHFDDVDHAGHASGYGTHIPKYMKSIEDTDKNIGFILKEISNRKDEDWLVIVTTDHGGIRKGHGGQTKEERTIFMIVHGSSVKKSTVSQGPGHTAVPPTVFKHLGLKINKDWGWCKAFGIE